MKYLLLTLIYIIKDWDLSLDEFNPIGKFLWWIPNFLNNIIRVFFKLLVSPIIFLWILFFEKNKSLILRFFVYWKDSLNEVINGISQVKE
jgi:hypothetical protein